MLQRDYFFEFAGMPKSGKTTVLDIVIHFLKRKDYLVGEYHGGGRYSPIDKSSIASLNLWLACKAVEFVIGTSEREKVHNRIFLLDRGLIDRMFFTDTLLRLRKIDNFSAQTISAFLILPELLEKLDGVFVFVTSPELSKQREYVNKLLKAEGRVMNTDFLSTLRSSTVDSYNKMQGRISNLHLIDTEQYNGQVQETARLVVENILKTIGDNG